MANFVLLTVEFKGNSRTLKESAIIQESFYKQNEENIKASLDNVPYSDFDSKNENVYGKLTVEVLTQDEAPKKLSQVDGLQYSMDNVFDVGGVELYRELMDNVIETEEILEDGKFTVNFELNEFDDVEEEQVDDVEEEQKKIMELLKISNY